MSKKSAIIILSIVIGLLLTAILYFSFIRAPRVLSGAMKAVSPKTAVLLEVKNYYNFSHTLREDTEFWPELIQESAFASLNEELISIDSTFKKIGELDVLVKKKPLLISLSVIGKSSIQPTYIIETDELTSEDALHNYIEQEVKETAKVKSKDYQNTSIKTVQFIDERNENLSYAFYKGLLICSPSELLVEEAVRQVDNSESITDQADFSKVYRTAGQHVDVNIFIQYKTFANLFKKYIHPNLQKSFTNIKYFANWTEMDVNIEQQSIFLNGFTQSNDSSNNYLNIFKNQSPGALDVSEVLPSSSSVVLSFNLSDLDLFVEKQERYLELKGKKDEQEAWFGNFNKQYQFNLKETLLEITEQEISLVYTQINPLDLSQNTFFIIETNGKSQTLEEMMPLLEKWAINKGVEVDNLIHEYQVTQDKIDLIYAFPKSDLAEQWLGSMFSHAKSNYFTFIEDYLIFGNSLKDIRRFIDENERKAVLENDTYFKQLQSEISSESNLYFYINIAASKDLFETCFSPDVSKIYNKSFNSLKKIQALVLQVNGVEDMLYSNVLLKYNPVLKEKPRTIWESKLDTLLNIKPEIVVNHRNSKKEIFIQDQNNTIYLVNRSGKILWKQKINQKIISKVKQIDYYKNNKLQYLFSTRDKIYIIDRNGNNVEDFPINLRAPATAGVAVFDYDGSRDYRFFIPCEDKKIYAYNIEGKILPGWVFGESEAFVKTEIQHYRIGDTDYILCADKNRIYILNRRGEEKIALKKNVQKSINNSFSLVYKDDIPYFSGTKPDGNIFMINQNGDVFEKTGVSVSKDHYAIITNINQNSLFDVVYSDNGELKILYDLKKKFSYDFDGKISQPVSFEFSSNNKKVGITNYSSRELYLFNGDGTLYKNFPLKGSTMFSISLLNNNGPKFNLITGSSDGFLYNYEVP